MSVEALSWSFKTDAGDASAKLVLLVLANFADEDGRCWPSQKVLGQRSHLSDRTVRDALGRLEERGLITRSPRYREDGGRSSDMIQLTPPGRNAGGEGEAPAKKGTTPQKPEGGGHPPGSSGLTTLEPTNLEPTNEQGVREQVQAIWDSAPLIARKRSTIGAVTTALELAVKRGKNPAAIRRAVAAYYADPDICREEHRYAKGVHRVIQGDHWETWAQAEGVVHLDGWTEDDARALQLTKFRFWMKEYVENPKRGDWDESVRGPRPHEPGCRIPASVMLEFGFTPPSWPRTAP